VTGAVGLAKQLGISPLIIGLTIVAMGTSAPEVAASIAAAARGEGNITIGNVYGSNIANLALVGALAALIQPISIKKQTLRRQMPVMLLVTLLLWPFVHNLYLSQLEGFLLLAVFAVLILLTVYLARKETTDESVKQAPSSEFRTPKKSILFIVVGLVGLALGAEMTVRGAVFIGQRAGLSKAVIGLTIIAIGTSLPELATCVAAAIKAQHDISIGTILGSNVFNALLALGVAGLIRPVAIVQRLAGVDYWVMVIISFAFASAAVMGRRIIGRATGASLLCGYLAYIVHTLAYSR
jgi:cation:H+ antiporter